MEEKPPPGLQPRVIDIHLVVSEVDTRRLCDGKKWYQPNIPARSLIRICAKCQRMVFRGE